MTTIKGDWLRGENYYILVASAIAMVLMFANQVAWTFVKDAVVENPTGGPALWYWGGQLLGISGFILLCVVGFRNALTFSFDKENLSLIGNGISKNIDYTRIESVREVAKIDYHRIYRPFAQTQRMFNTMYEKVIIVRADKQVFAFSFPHLDHAEFLECLAVKTGLHAKVNLDDSLSSSARQASVS